jgi:hypothetical protein
MNKEKINEYNNKLLSLLSVYLNEYDTIITPSQVKKITKTGVDELRAYSLLLQGYMKLDDEEIVDLYFKDMINMLDAKDYIDNDYYKNIKLNKTSNKDWKLSYDKYAPYQGFVFDDFKYEDDGRIIPQIGFFKETFKYPAIYQNNKLWMSITPNEIETMKEHINDARGKVVTFGLGMGYFAYMTSNKDNVSSITIVERDNNVIELFKKVILPQFKNKDKINIVNMDAFDFMKNEFSKYDVDYVFTDIYHDVSDALDAYNKMKEYEDKYKNTKFKYWIENTIKAYL